MDGRRALEATCFDDSNGISLVIVRWVVEHTHAWMNRFRRLLIRWEKKPENYLAFLQLASACITFRFADFFGRDRTPQAR